MNKRYVQTLRTVLGCFVILSLLCIPVRKAEAEDLPKVFQRFLSDGRWSDGLEWNGFQNPKTFQGNWWGCAAYCADFTNYCFGIANPREGTVFYNTSEIRAGDVITVGDQDDGTGHWFICLKRNGNSLYTAEGNYSNKVRVGWNYTIKSRLEFNQDSRTFTAGYHFMSGSAEFPAIDIGQAVVGVKAQVYTGKALKPAVKVKLNGITLEKGADYTVSYKNNKAVGKATAIVKGKGDYAGLAKATFKIKPKAVKGLALKAESGKLTVTWKKVAGVTGYQVQYGLKKDFKDAKTVTVKKDKTVRTALKSLKAGKTYYVRIRAYKTVKKMKYLSEWSNAVKGKTK